MRAFRTLKTKNSYLQSAAPRTRDHTSSGLHKIPIRSKNICYNLRVTVLLFLKGITQIDNKNVLKYGRKF